MNLVEYVFERNTGLYDPEDKESDYLYDMGGYKEEEEDDDDIEGFDLDEEDEDYL